MNGYSAPEVDFDRLENLTELARGGQGKVHDAPRIRINQSCPVVFKEYFPEVLARLGHLPQRRHQAGIDLDGRHRRARFGQGQR